MPNQKISVISKSQMLQKPNHLRAHVCAKVFRAKSTKRDGIHSNFSVERKYHNSLKSKILKIFREDQTLDFTCNESFETVEMAMMSWNYAVL